MSRIPTPLLAVLLAVSLGACRADPVASGQEASPGPEQALQGTIPSNWTHLRAGSLSAGQSLTLPFGLLTGSWRLAITCPRTSPGAVEVKVDTSGGAQPVRRAWCDGGTYLARLDGQGSVTLYAPASVGTTWNLYYVPDTL
ncbi:hypothetical protein [Streptomyces sp. NPDC056401]|uniref:hypothetical protein n=1 Tax=Streptomyces sp. NPDC056401 TaxID=3345809 RepID=UPI0035D960BA